MAKTLDRSPLARHRARLALPPSGSPLRAMLIAGLLTGSSAAYAQSEIAQAPGSAATQATGAAPAASSSAGSAQGAPAAVLPAAPVFALPAMNIFRRFPEAQTPQMVAFYEKVLGLRPLSPVDLGGGQQMILFAIGGAQIKLAAGLKAGRHNQPGAAEAATGLRMITLTYPDQVALAARLSAQGAAVPRFRPIGGGRTAAIVQDPGGFAIQLVVAPGLAAEAYERVEVGVNVTDLVRSRAFYSQFVGLEALPPTPEPLLGVTKYGFRNGATTISLWQKGSNLPADTGSAGIQYVVKNVDAINARALAQGVTVEEPLGGLPNYAVRFVWLNDPDGVTNYFAQTGVRAANAD